MPYSAKSQARLKKLHGVPLSLEQLNALAKQADAIGGDFGWPTAIKSFQKSHHIDSGKWVENAKSDKELHEGLTVIKEDDGRYKIIAVTTAALPDREDETFTTKAMDHEIDDNKVTGEYPEFRVFHADGLGIGKVEKMSRAGIFAVDEGHSYTDPFSQEVCEKMLVNNDGKWGVSRGFYAINVSGNCPKCNSLLGIEQKHMLLGYKCPVCDSTYNGYKGVLKNVAFQKTKTFDDTITDIPCQTLTGVSASKENSSLMEDLMDKKQLKERLLKAGLAEDIVDAKLAQMNDSQLKEFDGIPEAKLLKEFSDEPENTNQVEFVLDDSTLGSFAEIVKTTVQKEVKEQLDAFFDGLSIDIEDTDNITFKESPELAEIKELLQEVLKQFKKGKKDDSEEEDPEDVADNGDDEEAEGEAPKKKTKKEMPRGLRVLRMKQAPVADDSDLFNQFMGLKEHTETEGDEDVITGANGESASSLTEFMVGKQQ